MSWRKLICHDLRCGLLRPGYLLAPLVTLFPGYLYRSLCRYMGERGSWLDFLAFLFKGQSEGLLAPLPIEWLLAAGFCLPLNLGFFLGDLSLSGQQIMVRSGSRARWFLSKCLWNLASCFLYFCILGVCAVLMAGGNAALRTDPDLLGLLLNTAPSPVLSSLQSVAGGLILPCLTVAALSLLEMTLSMAVKPIPALILCVGLMVLSIRGNSGWILGTGAMTLRNQWVVPNGVSAAVVTAAALGTILLCAILGAVFFRRMDILPSEADL